MICLFIIVVYGKSYGKDDEKEKESNKRKK